MLEKLLGSGLRAKILGWLFTHHDERYFVRQLTGLLREDSTNISRELARLEKMGLLRCEKEGRQKYYQADPHSPIFSELRDLVVKTVGIADAVRDALEPVDGKIRAAFIYGSFARGDESASSDVDVLIVGNVKFSEIVSALGTAQVRLGREINPTVYSAAEFRSRLARGHHFLKGVMQGSKVFLIGDERELARLAGKSVAH